MRRTRRRPQSIKVVLAGLLLLPLLACSATDDDGRPTVVASFYPLQYLTEEIAGDKVRVLNLTEPGSEPHDLDPSVKQISEIADADLVLYVAGLAPAVDKATLQNNQDGAQDLTPYLDIVDGDPHFWLDPLRMAKAAAQIAADLEELDPDNAETYRTNLGSLTSALNDLDQAFTAGLANCERNLVVTSHDAFGYLSRYGLEFEEIAGLSPDAEPSPARIAQLRDLIADNGITTVFTESLISPKMAESLAEGAVTTSVLDPVESIADGDPTADYISVMELNLKNLETANGCTPAGATLNP